MSCVYHNLPPTMSEEFTALCDEAQTLGLDPTIISALLIAPLVSDHITEAEGIVGQRLDTLRQAMRKNATPIMRLLSLLREASPEPSQSTKKKNGLITSEPHNTDNQSQVVNNASVGRFVSLTGHKKGLARTQVEAHVPSRDAARRVLGRRTLAIPHELVNITLSRLRIRT